MSRIDTILARLYLSNAELREVLYPSSGWFRWLRKHDALGEPAMRKPLLPRWMR